MSMSGDDTLHEKVGYIRGKMDSIAQKVDVVCDTVASTNVAIQKLSESAVSDEVCAARRGSVTDTLRLIRDDLTKKQTRQGNPVVPTTPKAEDIAARVVEKINGGTPPKNLITRIKDNLLSISIIVAAVTAMIVGGIKLSYFVVEVDKTLKKTKEKSAAQSKAIKKQLQSIQKTAARPKYIYIRVPVMSDAGPLSLPKKPRRRPRPRRTP